MLGLAGDVWGYGNINKAIMVMVIIIVRTVRRRRAKSKRKDYWDYYLAYYSVMINSRICIVKEEE